MAFKKGTSGNPAGRPVGAKGRAKADLLERITTILDENLEKIQEDIESMEPNERVKALTALLNYALPKRQAVNVEQSIDYEYSKLAELIKQAPDEVVDLIAEKVKAMNEIKGDSCHE